MKKIQRLVFLVIPLLVLSGCITRQATFVDFANGQTLKGMFKDSMATDGSCEVTMADGEVLSGRYSGVRESDSVTFGSAFVTASAVGTGGAATGSASSFGSFRTTGGQGRAYALLTSQKPGSKLMMEVIAVYGVLDGHGWGEARTNDGRTFKVQF